MSLDPKIRGGERENPAFAVCVDIPFRHRAKSLQ
jgi:hypothetical protein